MVKNKLIQLHNWSGPQQEMEALVDDHKENLLSRREGDFLMLLGRKIILRLF